VRPEGLYLLNMATDGLKLQRPLESYGKTVERILEDLMGLETTRPDEVKAELRYIHNQIDSGNLDDAKGLINKMREKIGADPDLVKAEVLIRRKELIGK